MKVCLELSRRCRRRFLSMMNREAFDEVLGIAGWWLRRLGCFSVERGGHSEVAKRFAIDVVTHAREVLVVFREGEIYFLNDLVQPFKSGAIEIGMQALVEMRQGSAEVYGTKRPRQLANRDVFLKMGEPNDLSRFVASYLEEAQAVRHGVAGQLRDVIQALIDAVTPPRRPAVNEGLL